MGTAWLSPLAVVDRLAATYGEPAPPVVTDLFEQILWENVAYLADDGPRAAAFAALREQVGTAPEGILAAPDQVLVAVASAGILPIAQAAKLRRCAEIALAEFGGDLGPLRRLPLAPAKRALRRFPGIGEPGAEKIVLFARIHPVPALDSNGLRALLRLGFGREAPSYATTYRAVQAAVRDQLPVDADGLIRVHQLLRQHGRELCRRSAPRCDLCPLAPACRYDRGVRGARAEQQP